MARLDTSVDAWVDRLEEGEGDEFSATFRIRTRLPATRRFPVTNGTVRVTYHKTLVEPATCLKTCAHRRRRSWSNRSRLLAGLAHNQHIRLRRADLYTSINAMKPLGLVDEEKASNAWPADDDVTYSPQALPEQQEDDTEKDRTGWSVAARPLPCLRQRPGPGRRAEAVSVGENA